MHPNSSNTPGGVLEKPPGKRDLSEKKQQETFRKKKKKKRWVVFVRVFKPLRSWKKFVLGQKGGDIPAKDAPNKHRK